MVRCELCGWETENESLEEHLQTEHFIGYRRYYERVISGGSSDTCWKCGYPRWLFASHLSEYLPCEACGQNCSKRVYDERRNDILGMIKEYQSSLGKNKFHQYLLATSGIDMILGGILQTGLDLLGKKKREMKLRLDKNAIPLLDFREGAPKEISERNLDNIILGIRNDIEVTQEGRDFRVNLGRKEYKILAPEIVEYDTKHHSRHSILNPSSKRSSKRLRLKGGSGDCIKFWGTQRRSILRITMMDEPVELKDLPKDVQDDIKSVVLCVKPLREMVLEIYNEILMYCDYLYDRAIFLSHFSIPNQKTFKLYISWDGYDFPEIEQEGEIIKLSIL